MLPSLLLTVLACAPLDSSGPRLPPQVDPSEEDPVRTLPADLHTADARDRDLGLTYEIYVRSFQDSDGDGIGDLEGVRLRLEHLAAMGVRTLWLMPLFPAFWPAGYDVTDFDRLRPEYGEVDALLTDAHARGMRVILDLPLNHVARTHPWFQAADADPTAPERDLFLFADTQWDQHRWFPAAGGGYFYGFFGADLPDLDWTHPEVQTRMFEVFEAWLRAGFDGYRLDAVTMLVEADGAITNTDATHALLAELYQAALATKPEAVILAEASEPDVAGVLGFLGDDGAPESDRVLDFPRRTATLEALAAGSPAPLLDVLEAELDAGALHRTSPFVSSHDLPRLPATVPDPAARRLLQVLQLTLPGDPILYYGEELDLADASNAGPDAAQRAPMPWDASPNGGFTTGTPWFPLDPGSTDVAAAETDSRSLLWLIRDLACVREAIEGADWEAVSAGHEGVLAYSRATADGRLIVVANLRGEAVGDVRVDVHGGLLELTRGVGVDAGDGLVVQGLRPYGYALYADEIATGCSVAGPA